MEFDEKKYAEALVELERVYAVDEGPVGTEARLIAGIALVKLDRAGEAAAILEVATKSESGTGRAPMSLALAHFLAGDTKAAETALEKALTANPSLGKVLLGRIPKRPANLSAATPGSREEAFGYAQTYGDAWDDKAKKFLDSYIATRSSVQKEASPSEDLSEAG
jgi:tetratricopeptide (TPR) repeat protein